MLKNIFLIISMAVVPLCGMEIVPHKKNKDTKSSKKITNNTVKNKKKIIADIEKDKRNLVLYYRGVFIGFSLFKPKDNLEKSLLNCANSESKYNKKIK